MRLSKNFELWEFEKSETAFLNGIDNRVPVHLQRNIVYVASQLQIIRNYVNQPVHITSGYRSPRLNRIVSGASPTSLHMQCLAADFYVSGWSSARLVALVRSLNLPVREIIQYPGESRIHLGFLPPRA